jgi:DnaK suppressor protein
MRDEATVFADPNDRATQSDMGLELRNRDRERKLIKKSMRCSPRLMR